MLYARSLAGWCWRWYVSHLESGDKSTRDWKAFPVVAETYKRRSWKPPRLRGKKKSRGRTKCAPPWNKRLAPPSWKAPVFIKHKHLLKVELGRMLSDAISSWIHQILSRQKYEIRKCQPARDEAAEEPRATSCVSASVQLGGLGLNFNTFWAQTLKWCVHSVKNCPSRSNLAGVRSTGCTREDFYGSECVVFTTIRVEK